MPQLNFFRFCGKKKSQKFGGFIERCYLCNALQKARAFSSAGLERLPYKQRVGGSNPSTPTWQNPVSRRRCGIFFKEYNSTII